MKEAAELDHAFPKQGVCAFCGKDARHRTIDAIQDRFKVGETVEELADDYDLPEESIRIAIRDECFPTREAGGGQQKVRGI